MSTIRPDVAVRVARGGPRGRAARARRPGQRRRGRRDRGQPVDHGGRRARATSRPRGRCSRPSARRSCTSAPPGSGQTVKAANQLIVAGNIQLLAEAVVFLEAYGVDTKAALEVLGGGLAGSTVLNRKGANMLDRKFEPGFRLALHHKDLGIVTSAAREAGVVDPARRGGRPAGGARMVARGDGGLDHSGLLKLVAELSGRRRLIRARDHPTRTAGGADMARMTAADAAVAILEREGVTHAFGVPGRGDQPLLRRDAPHTATIEPRARPPRRGRLAHGRGLHPGPRRQHRRLHRHLRPRGHRHDHRPVLGVGRLDPDPVHHRPGAGRPAAQGGLPGRRHRVDRRAADQDGGHRAGGRAGPGRVPARPST